MHTLWLGYISELLALPLLLPPTSSASYQPTTSIPPTPIQSTSELLPTFPVRATAGEGGLTSAANCASFASDLKINVTGLHGKLVKAEYVGCLITGSFNFYRFVPNFRWADFCGALLSVKRAKNPSLVNLTGLVLQETQGTFKIVTTKSRIKGTSQLQPLLSSCPQTDFVWLRPVLPKKGSIFNFSLPLLPPPNSARSTPGTVKRELSFDILGDAFCYRSAERVGKKWKAGNTDGGVSLI